MEEKKKISKKTIGVIIAIATILVIGAVCLVRKLTVENFADESKLMICLLAATIALCGLFLANIFYIVPNMKKDEEKESHYRVMKFLCIVCGTIITLGALLCIVLWFLYFGRWYEGYGYDTFAKFLPYGLCFLLLGILQFVEYVYWKKELEPYIKKESAN